MDEQKFSLSGSFRKAREYIDTQLELMRLQAVARVSRILGALIVDISKLILALIVVFFLAMALGFYLGEVLGSNALGFLTTGGIFLFFLLIVRVFEPKIEAKFMDTAVRKFYNKWNEEEEEDIASAEEQAAADKDGATQPEEHERKDQ